jgi:hypothetical protein
VVKGLAGEVSTAWHWLRAIGGAPIARGWDAYQANPSEFALLLAGDLPRCRHNLGFVPRAKLPAALRMLREMAP